MVAPPHYKHYPRSVSWQVASVLNPSLHNSLPPSQLSTHCREKREREGGLADHTGSKLEGKPQSAVTAYKSWLDEEERGHKLALPPQYVSRGELCKAMPKYIRLKVRPTTNGNGQPVPFFTATSTEPVNPYSPGLSPGYDLAAGSPQSQNSSGREVPRSVLDFPQNTSTTCKTPQQAKSASGTGAASPASPARSLKHTPLVTAKSSCETTPPVSAGFHNTPLSTSELRRLKAGPPSGEPSPRIRSAATSPMPPIPAVGCKVTDATPASATVLRAKLNRLAEFPKLMPRMVQMESTAQGSPLSPANSVEASRLRNSHGRLSTPPVALPPTPPIGSRPGSRQGRLRNPHPPEPTLETYKKASPNTHATNTVWNDRRDTSREQTNPRHSILIKST